MCDLKLKNLRLSSPSAASSPVKPTRYEPRTEYDFVSEITEDISCSICLSVLVQPNLTDCCGNHFCKDCIARVREDGRPCPLCQEASFTTMLNKSLSRRLNQLQVKCPNTNEGCSWTGELGRVDKHVQDSCEFLEIPCDFRCGEYIIRRYLPEHKSTSCKRRRFACKYCHWQGTWLYVTEKHYPICRKFPVSCPNGCDVGEIPRELLKGHLSVCPLQVIDCTFQFAGCKVSLPRGEMQQHVSDNTASHLLLGFQSFHQQLAAKDEEITKLKATIETMKTEQEHSTKQLKATNDSYAARIGDLNTRCLQTLFSSPSASASVKDDHCTYPPCHFTMTNVQHHMDSNLQWFSDPFYSHKGGYKMCLSVFANGSGVSLNKSVSVFINIMRGENDVALGWPFRGSITVALYLEDGSGFEGKCKFNARSPGKAAGRVEYGDRRPFGQGTTRFVDHIQLTGDDKRFLNFCVAAVDVLSSV